ncbi:hypothetical protein NLU13_2178 [Sarocladium strictum]|uniref:SCP domain-containing protein n=1 Tax=Sarocladium strictum TaxID=5046 RepID=A0AA39GTV8_SARSR|nr:hypothetical protein NLU13_2178 [Sarocladium strictum]
MKLFHFLASVALYSMGVFSQSDDAAKAVATINQARQAHGLQPLTWHPDLATYAQYWADRMGSGQEPFHHASGVLRPSQGETLYQEQSMQCDPAYDTPLQSAVKDWLGQAPLYTGQAISTGQEPWLHFSQCMWSQSTQIGCGRAFSISEPYKFFDVCRFFPEGNIIGQRPF